MYDKIDSGDITIQVESTRENREALDSNGDSAIAISQGAFDRGLSQEGVAYTEQRMNKNGDLNNIQNWTDVTNWVADAGYPGTVITSHGMVIQQSAQVVLEFKGLFGNGFFTRQVNSYIRILVNGNVVKTGSGNAILGIYYVMYLKAGDVVKIQARCQNYLFDASKLRGGRGTYLRVRLNAPGEFDFESDLAWPENTGFSYVGNDKWVVVPRAKKGKNPLVYAQDTSDGTGIAFEGFSIGPVVAQSRVPWPVKGGQTVNFSGIFKSKGSPEEESDFSGSTIVLYRFSLWASGITTDEYGTETENKLELMYYQASNATSSSSTTTFNISGIPAATVPEGMTNLYFTVSTVYQVDGTYGAINFEIVEGSMSVEKASYFAASVVTPIQVIINQPTTINPVYTHPLSKTNVAFKNPSKFSNIFNGAQLTFFGAPDASTTVQVYNFNGTRGTLIGTYTAAANVRETATLNPSTQGGGIELVTTSGINYVEKVVNSEEDTLMSVTDQLKKITFVNVEDDVSRISILREEADKSTATIDFATATLDPAVSPLLKPGKTIRILGRHYGEGNTSKPVGWSGPALYSTIYTGKVKRVNSGYSYEDDPVVQVTASDATDSLQSVKPDFVSDQMIKYGAWFNSLGSSVVYNGIDWAGSMRDENDFPNKFVYEPSSWGSMTLADSISTTRNSNKWWWFVDRFNKLRIMETLSATSKYTLTDGTLAGQLNYGTFSRGSDTDAVINKISVEEHTLDMNDLKNRTLSASSEPPADLDFVKAKRQSVSFTNKTSANAYGEFSKTFDVVRGNGNYLDLSNGYNGANYKTWSETILAERSEPTINVSDLNIPIKNSLDIKRISELEILDKVDIAFKGTSQYTRVREIEHTIMPGRWYTEIKFNSKGDMSYW